MSILIPKPKVSSVISYQLPEYVQRDHPHFIEFLSEYYKFMEQESGPSSIIRNSTENIDVDKTTNQFLGFIESALIPVNEINRSEYASAKEEFIKSLRDFYMSKGTEN